MTDDTPLSTGAAPDTPRLPRPPLRARLPVLLLGVLLVFGSAVGVATWSRGLAERESVLVASRAIEAGTVIGAGDLRVAELAGAAELDTLPASFRDELVGATAISDVRADAVLSGGMFSEGAPVGPGEAVVGVVLEPGAVPVPRLRPDDTVEVVRLGGGTGEGAATPLTRARVLAVRAVSESTPTRAVSLVVPGGDAVAVADAAGAGRIWLVLVADAVETEEDR